MIEITEIRKKWEERQPNRAAGGRRALSGFHYQINATLYDFFYSLVNNRFPNSITIESIADFTKTAKDGVYVTEHKRTLRTSNFLGAIDEFLILENFLTELYPLERLQIKFKVVTSKNYVPNSYVPPLDDIKKQKIWNNILSENRFLGIEEIPDPWMSLVKLLWPKVDHPVSLISECNQTILEAIICGNTGEICRQLIEAYERKKLKYLDGVAPLLTIDEMTSTPEFQAPELLSGQRPEPKHWKNGYFIQRPQYSQLVMDALLQIRDVKDRPIGKTPIVWIVGGSGVGKSTLLLEVMFRLLSEDDSECAWLRGSPIEIARTLEKSEKQRLIIGVDDFYAPHWRDDAQWNHLVLLVRANQDRIIWVASSPKEYYEAFRQNSQIYELFHPVVISVDSPDEKEREEFYEWFSKRTALPMGSIARVVGGESNFVLMAFRCNILLKKFSSLEDFCSRLWDRLVDLGIETEAAISLASNRLGIPTLTEVFGNPAAADALTRLDLDGLFSVFEEETVGSYGSKKILIHRRLAEAMYELRFAPDMVAQRASHLLKLVRNDASFRRFLVDQIHSGKISALESEMLSCLVRTRLMELDRVQFSTEVFWELSGWQKCAKKNEIEYSGEMIRRLLEKFFSSGAVPQGLLGYLIDICWSVLDIETLLKVARPWLDSNFGAGRWHQVWQKVWVHQNDRLMWELGFRWITEHRDDFVGWTYVWQRLFEDSTQQKRIIEEALIASSVLLAHRAEWPLVDKVHSCLSKEDGKGLFDFNAYLVNRILVIGNHYLLERLEKKGIRPSIALIEQLCSRAAIYDGAGNALQVLLRQAFIKQLNKDDIQNLCIAVNSWLAGREDSLEWSHVWKMLVGILPMGDSRRQDLWDVGIGWLAGREDRPEWNFVWQKLVDVLPLEGSKRQGLLDVGIRWLAGREDRPEWSHVWRKLVDVLPLEDSRRQGLLDVGIGWLAGREDRPEWNFVWEKLVDVFPLEDSRRQGLLDVGIAWLAGREDRPGWSFEWQKLVDIVPLEDPRRRGLLDGGIAWLSGREGRPGWNFEWQKLVDIVPLEDPRRQGLLDVGIAWLSGREGRPGWRHVRRKLVDILPLQDPRRNDSCLHRK